MNLLRRLARTWRTVRGLRFSQLAWRVRNRVLARLPVRVPRVETAAFRDPPFSVGNAGRAGDGPHKLENRQLHLPHIGAPIAFDPANPDWRLGPRSTERLQTITLHYHEWLAELFEAAGSTATESNRRAGGVSPRRGASVDASISLGKHGPHALAETEEAGQNERGAPATTSPGADAPGSPGRSAGSLLTHWLDHCHQTAPGARHLAWNSYAIATRLVAWARIVPHITDAGLRQRMVTSAAQQAEYLHRHIEWDLLANHLMRDAVGLAVAAAMLDTPQADTWRQTARRIALAQVQEQILPDGGHFERSPMYHLQVMGDLLVLGAAFADDAPMMEALRNAFSRMAAALQVMRHPDGLIAQFNDATLHGAAHPDAILAAGQRVFGVDPPPRATGACRLPDFGLFAFHGADWTVFFDIGEVGPAVQPGHAHADTLSVEVSFRGQRLIVDPGTFDYDAGPLRDHCRGTAAHNTACVDAADSSEVWHIFRTGRRATPRLDTFEDDGPEGEGGWMIAAAHDGYGRSRRHRRELRFEPATGRLTIRDQAPMSVRGLLLAPGVNVEPDDADNPAFWRLVTPAGRVRLDCAIAPGIEPAEWFPEFGVRVPCQRLVWRAAGTTVVTLTPETD